jgi:threonine dehydrogenase-like Zn-dependent dehydrogenase
MAEAIAMVQAAPRDLTETGLPKPTLEEGAALIRVEACGLCGSDVESMNGHDWANRFPRIMGHEIVGVIEELGPGGRRGFKVGDRVAIDPWLTCGVCRYCLMGRAQFCTGWDFKQACYGYIPTDVGPGLWGGYASHVYAHPKTVLYLIPEHVGALTATLWNPLAAGIQWGVVEPGTSPGSKVVILGSGQRGLACVVATKAAGAGQVIVTGLSKDARKLELARAFGADVTIDVEQEDPIERVLHLTGGEGADIVIDTSAFSTQPVADAIAMVRPAGTIVFAGIKHKEVPNFPVDQAIYKAVRMQAVLGMTSEAYRRAVDMLAAGRAPLDEMRTHVFDIREAIRAVDVLSGVDPKEDAINVVLANAD